MADLSLSILSTNRLILTNDDYLLTDFSEESYCGLLFIEDERLTTEQISDIVHSIAEIVAQENVSGLFYVSREWSQD